MAVYPATKMSNFAYFAYFYSPNPSCSILTLLSPDYTLQIFCIFLIKNLQNPISLTYLCTRVRFGAPIRKSEEIQICDRPEVLQRPSKGRPMKVLREGG